MSDKKALVIGHSFVYSMDDLWRRKYSTCPVAALEKYVAEELRVARNVSQVFMCGQRGAHLGNFVIPKVLLQNLKPDVVILDLGTNDLARGTTPDELVTGLQTLSKALLCYCPWVVILSIVPRGAGFVESVNEDSFRDAMQQVNNQLQKFQWQGVIFCKAKGFYAIQTGNQKELKPISDWSYDGIHPNNRAGRMLYAKAIRLAICLYLKAIQ